MNKDLNIAILSLRPNSYSAGRFTDAAHVRGHQVVFFNTLKALITENIESTRNSDLSNITGFDAVIPRIGTPLTDIGISYLRLFETAGIFSTATSQGIYLSRDKLLALQTLQAHGLSVPKTVTIASTDNVAAAMSYVGGAPLIIKLLKGSQGRSVILAETDMSAKSLIETLVNMKEAFIIQEFIKESSGSDIRCFVVDGKVVGAMKRISGTGDFRSNLHQGGSAIAIEITKQERRAAIKSAQVLGLNVAGVDILRSHSGPKVLEVNSSPGLQGIETATGKDIAGAIIESIEDNVRSVIGS